ncbi:MAG: MotA/TolQ/ExbB proton channel family protein [Planctomycetota bacterium]|nr:MAG: MotA/TolQ/ExbB proton channel family protein [Planctomycetota bacterium]
MHFSFLTAAAPALSSSVFDMLRSGGVFMIPLALCSILALAFALDRAWRMRWKKLGSAGFGDALLDAYRGGGVPRALALCRETDTPLARMFEAGLLRSDEAPERAERAVEDAGAREVRALSTALRPLVVIASIAPLLGLLGTVWGIILCFQRIGGGSGIGRPEALADGISQALVTTAAGLVIAIPAQAVYYAFRARIDGFLRRAEQSYERFVAGVKDPFLATASEAPPIVHAAVPVSPAPSAEPAS